MIDFEALHDEMPEEAHSCGIYNLSPEECYRSWPCTKCGSRRDEHADQTVLQSAHPELDITDHYFTRGE